MAIVNLPTPGAIPNIASGTQVTVGAAATLIVDSRDLRIRLLLKNNSSTPGENIFLDGVNTLTTSTGFLLGPGESVDIKATSAIYGITAGANIVAYVLEEYITTG